MVRIVEEEDPAYADLPHVRDPFGADFDWFQAFPTFQRCASRVCDRLLGDAGLIRQLREERYDHALVPPYDGCGLALAHVLRIPGSSVFVGTGNGEHIYEGLGVPTPPSYLSCEFGHINAPNC